MEGWQQAYVAAWHDWNDNVHCILIDRRVGLDGLMTYWSSGPFPLKKHLITSADVGFGIWPEEVCNAVRYPHELSDGEVDMLRADERHFNEAALLLRKPVGEALECSWRDELKSARAMGKSLWEELGLGHDEWADAPDPFKPL